MEKGLRPLGGTQALLRDIHRIETWKRSKGQAHDFIQAIHRRGKNGSNGRRGKTGILDTPAESQSNNLTVFFLSLM